jgi:transketolase
MVKIIVKLPWLSIAFKIKYLKISKTSKEGMSMSVNPLKANHFLCKASNLKPQFTKVIKNKKGNEVVCSDPSANRTLVALMDLAAVNGGAACHWGGPAASAEVLSALHEMMFQYEDWYEKFNFVNDIGHAENGIYALRANYQYGGLKIADLKGFRSIESKLTGHGESHLYPEGVLLSNGPLGSALAQTQGLAMADKLRGNDRKTVCLLSDGASMEGEAKEAFAAIPGLFKKGRLNPYILIVSDNNTKLSGRIDEDSFDMTPSFSSLEVFGMENSQS